MLDKSEMIFGVRAVIEAIQAGKEIDKILVKNEKRNIENFFQLTTTLSRRVIIQAHTSSYFR